jgi:hypothetical protein
MAKVISDQIDRYNAPDNDPRMNNLLHEIVGWLCIVVVIYLIFS